MLPVREFPPNCRLWSSVKLLISGGSVPTSASLLTNNMRSLVRLLSKGGSVPPSNVVLVMARYVKLDAKGARTLGSSVSGVFGSWENSRTFTSGNDANAEKLAGTVPVRLRLPSRRP